MSDIILKCKGCGEEIKISTATADLVLQALHLSCAFVYAQA